MISRQRWTLAVSAALFATAVLFAAVAAQPASSLPSYKSTCSSCHGAPTGTVTATPSSAMPAAGAAYTVTVNIGLTSSGRTGYWISNNDAGTPAVSIAAGPASQTSWSAAMTAPASPGTYTYKVWTAKGHSGQAKMATYSITVPSDGGPAPTPTPTPTPDPQSDTTAPETTASGARNDAWFNDSVTVTLDADDGDGDGVDSITYAVDGGAPATVNDATAEVTIAADLVSHADDGAHTVSYQATDLAGNTESLKTLTVNLDTVAPTSQAGPAVKVRRGGMATLRYKVLDALPTSGVSKVVIKIVKRNGKVVKTLRRSNVTANVTQSVKYRCALPRGSYRFAVFATDGAGNEQTGAKGGKLVIR